MRRLLVIFLLPLLTAMGEYPVGTAVTLAPVAGDSDAVDPRLLGSWRLSTAGPPSKVTLTVRRSKDFLDRYEVDVPFYFARPVEGRLVRFPVGDKLLSVIECSVRTRAQDTGLLLPARHHFGVRFEGDRLVVSLLSVQLGYMARTGGGAHGAPGIKDLETTFGGPVAVIVADGTDVQEHLAFASRRMLPQWILTFERER
jgi:hypothetical protein